MFNEHLQKLPNDLKNDMYEKAFGEHVNINEQSQVDVYFYSSLFSNVNVLNDLYDLHQEKCYFRTMICLICRDKLDSSSCNYYDMFIESCFLSVKSIPILKLMTSLMHNIYYCYHTGNNYKFYDAKSNNYSNDETCDDYVDYENCNVIFKIEDLQPYHHSILKKTSKIFYSANHFNREILKLIYDHNMFEPKYIPISNTLFEHQVYADKITYVIHFKLWKVCELYVNQKLSHITKHILYAYIIKLIFNCTNKELDLSVFLDKYNSGITICDVLFQTCPNTIFKFHCVELSHVDYICEKYPNVARKWVTNIKQNMLNYNVALMFLTNRLIYSGFLESEAGVFMFISYKTISEHLKSDLWKRLSPEIYKKLVDLNLSFSDEVKLHFYINFDIDVHIKVLCNIITAKLDKSSESNAFVNRLLQPNKITHYADCLNMLLERDPEKKVYVEKFLGSNSKLYTVEVLKTISVKLHCIHDVIIDIICKKCEQQNQLDNKFVCCVCLTNTVEYSSTCGHSVCSECFSQNPQSKCPLCNNKNYKKNAHKLY